MKFLASTILYLTTTMMSMSTMSLTSAFVSPHHPTFHQKTTTNPVGSSSLAKQILSMSSSNKEPDAKIMTQSGGQKKNIGYDENSGRFYEMLGECDPQNEYCVLDEDSGKYLVLTVEEKERIFLDALQSYYASGRQMLSDDDFDLLKEDLSWAGSDLVNMNRKEAKYLNSMQAYLKGSPIMSDTEFDSLKAELKEDGSKFAVNIDPTCYIDTGVCKVTLQEDKFRSNLLYLPIGAILTIFWLGVGYELLGGFIRINPIIFAALGSPLIYTQSKALTENFIFKNNKIAYGPCPVCEAENRVYFGDILGVEGHGDVAEVKCTNCKETFRVQRDTLRASTLPKNT